MEHLIPARRPDQVIIKKKEKKEKLRERTCSLVDFVFQRNTVKMKENKKRTKKTVEHEGNVDNNCNWRS